MNIKELQEFGAERLKKQNVDEPLLKTKLLLSFVIKRPKEYLIIHQDEKIKKETEEAFLKELIKLEKKIPLAYIINNQEFMKLNFYVDENVLIPRPDTEILVEEVIKRCKGGKILDLCTGSGAIGVSLAKYILDSQIFATDISKQALDIAKRNACKNGVNITFIESDLFNNINEKYFDVIVSNPPYIETSVIETLQEEVKKEPKLALDGGTDGLYFYRKIISKAPNYLKIGGLLALEIGYNQAEQVVNLLKNCNCYKDIEVKQDLSGNDRVIIATVL